MDHPQDLQKEEEKEGLTLNQGDDEQVEALLGRAPRGSYEVVVRADDGTPRVLRNAPILDDGTPMPTRYWLVGPDDVMRVSRLESAGGVRRAEAAVDPNDLADAHLRYADERVRRKEAKKK